MDVSNLPEDDPERVRVEQSRRVWRALNIGRERLSRLNAPFVFWLSQNVLGQAMQYAADVYAARSGIYLFEVPIRGPEPPPSMRSEAMVSLLDRFSRTLLPPEELRKRAALYEQRLVREWAAAEPNWPGLAFLGRDLANIYLELDDFERAGTFQDEAINAYRKAITQREQGAKNRRREWAALQEWLGTIYAERIRGDRAENIEQAIEAYQQALQVLTRQAMPVEWAGTMNNLANAYAERIRGKRAENLERAIDAYRQALQVRTHQAMPVEWAQTMNSLANAYFYRIRGERAENLERAIDAYQQALQVGTRQAMPVEWATTMNNLAIAYRNRTPFLAEGERAENLERAIDAHRQALQVRTRQAMPVEWAATMNNLALAYANRIQGERAENLERAIDAYRQALEIYSGQVVPEQQADLQYSLGLALLELGQLTGQQQAFEQAEGHLKEALRLYEQLPDPARLASVQEALDLAISN